MASIVLVSVASVGGVVGLPLSQDDPSAAEEDLPPGVTDDGVSNASALVEAHQATVNESGVVYETHTNYILASAGMQAESTEAGVISPGLSTFRTQSSGSLSVENCTITYDVEQWGNDSLMLIQYEFGNQTQYVTQNLTPGANEHDGPGMTPSSGELTGAGLSQSLLLAGVLETGNFTVAETRTVDDRTLTTLRADELNESIAQRLGTANISHYEATVTVDETGLVHALAIDATVERDGQPSHIDYGFDVLALGPTEPLQPPWARTALDTVSAGVFVDDAEDHFEIVNHHGDTVPANTTIELAHENATHDLTLDEGLAPGEGVYVYYPTNESTPVLEREPPANGSAQALDGTYEFVIRTPAEQVLIEGEYEIGNGTSASFSYGGMDPFWECEELDGEALPGMTALESEEAWR